MSGRKHTVQNYLLHNLASALGFDQQGVLHHTVSLSVQTTVGITELQCGCTIKMDWWPQVCATTSLYYGC